MIDMTTVSHHPAVDEIVDIICKRTKKEDRSFFQAVTAYYLSTVAASMRAVIDGKTEKQMPVNTYAVALATSGYGKGHCVSIFENEIVNRFRLRFRDDTFEVALEKNLWSIANQRAAINGTGQQEEFDKLERDVKSLGPYMHTFDAGSSPAIKQLRLKLLHAKAGSLNLKVDEIGQHLEGSNEALGVFLELYDLGLTEAKLTKNSKDNMNLRQVDGFSPANMLLFGTPDDLFDGDTTERRFREALLRGYARRCIFGEGIQPARSEDDQLTLEKAAAIYHSKAQAMTSPVLDKWSKHFHDLADPAMLGWSMDMEDEAGEYLTFYELYNIDRAHDLGSHQATEKIELSHRHTKARKLSGVLAFIDMSPTIEKDAHVLPAIKLVEESGETFVKMLDREANYEKLAKYIATANRPLTHPDIMANLPFYKQSQSVRNDLMSNAIAWGYTNHIIIKKTFQDGVERFTGESLQETDLEKVMLSYSEDWAWHYEAETVAFDQLHLLTQAPGMHWTNHAFTRQHRAEENVIPGFNLAVLDIDGGTTLETVHELMKDYRFMTYTTKRHDPNGQHRFRLILPINYVLKLESQPYKEFMNALMEWLPFASDEAANQRSKKWESYDKGSFHYNDGQLVDALPFIPSTSRNAEYTSNMKQLASLDNLERWFAQRIANGNRNNHLIKFALALADSGMDLMEVNTKVHEFNKKLSNSLAKEEIDRTIMVTVAKHFQKAEHHTA